MMHRLSRSARILALACSPALLLGLLHQQPVPPPAAVQPYQYTGTIHALQSKTGSLDLITGVGHAMRLVHITTVPATRAMSGVAAITFADLAPGDRLRADCRMTDSGLVADRIEKLPASGRAP